MSGGLDLQFLTGSSHLARERDDFYPTPAWATQALLDREQLVEPIWEPACGDGAITKVLLANGYVVAHSSDLIDRGFGEAPVDFLTARRSVATIVTNPPYRLARDFVLHALENADTVAMLLKLNFLEGQRRKPLFESTPLRKVYVFSRRVSFDKGTERGRDAGLLAYAWYVWDRSHRGAATLGWI